ncbi:hypothetical protein ABL78_4994 [Leptomonas seymouri]|uniref:Protein ZIP4 homolog n=1 Tax=Leptomonas seymouri TaxID=5684 RepID=A0A0N1PCQ0_LEPSE|nr:hypothetical protein ABL78_4994 [Leptomonas seymouri]|eukprot:KPI85951.1 hypothetical protein ABL78_4994 [Leptomonas seymouri]
MPDSGGDAPSLVACADWLRTMIRKWTDVSCLVDVADAQAALRQRLADVERFSSEQACLPVKTALQLQLSGQDCWNSTFLLPWSPERRSLKRSARRLAAYLFLASHHIFAPPDVCAAYMSCHLDDAEKCILMCLKVSKSQVSQTDTAGESQRMLAWASAIVAACRNVPSDKVGQWAVEVHFAQLHVLWRSGQFAQVCAVAEKLAQQTHDSTAYREALFEFIHEAAMKVTCGAEETEEPSTDANHHGGSAERDNAAQALLSLSLQLQTEEDVRTLKQQNFLGMTELQLSCVLVKTGAYAAAVDAAVAAYEHLHTFEPLIVRLKAESLRHNTDGAVQLFAALCTQENNITFAELCAIAACVLESNPTMERDVGTLLERRTASAAAPAGQEDRLRFLCFLLHVRSEWSLGELVRLLCTAEQHLDKSFHRFFFCSLWQVGLCGEASEALTRTADHSNLPGAPARLSAELKWRCLSVAVSRFSTLGSSDAERQSVLLDMSRLAIEMQPDTLHHSTEGEGLVVALQQTWSLWTQETTLHPALRPPALLVQAQLAFILGKRDEGLQRAYDLWSSGEGEDASVRSSAALINFLIVRSMLEVAGDVAQHCIPRLAPQPPQCVLDFAKVCALGCLAADEDAVMSTVSDLLLAHVCPLLIGESASLSPSTASWWSRLLWYVGDRLLEGSPSQAVRLSYAAVCCVRGMRGCTEDESVCGLVLLHSRVSALLEAEFDLFMFGQPPLTVSELRQIYALLTMLSEEATVPGSAENTCCAPEHRTKVTLALANIEAVLRQLEESNDIEGTDIQSMQLASLRSLPGVEVEDLEQVAVVCHRVAASVPSACAFLSAAAVTLQTTAAESQYRLLSAGGNNRDAVYALLSMLHVAYGMASNADAREAVFTVLMTSLGHDAITPSAELICTVLRSRSLDNTPPTGHADRLVETAVEFFAVEAWNESVQWNVLQRRDRVATWRAWALTLADMLDSTNASKVAIIDLSRQMPLL